MYFAYTSLVYAKYIFVHNLLITKLYLILQFSSFSMLLCNKLRNHTKQSNMAFPITYNVWVQNCMS